MPVTFITSFFSIFSEEFDGRKTTSWRIEKFKEIAETGIPICIYLSKEFENTISNLGYTNVKIMKSMDIQDLWIYKETKKVEYSLPNIRNNMKDIDEYMMAIQSKLEFMTHAIAINPWDTEYFAWIDFNISHVFHNKKSFEFLKILSRQNIKPNSIIIPGCWKSKYEDNLAILEQINWRFCGGFFVGDAKSILQFHIAYLLHYPEFMKTHHKLVWEVNFWVFLEKNNYVNFDWYYADHTDEMMSNIPSRYFVNPISLPNIYSYHYPSIEHYSPSSASYLYHNGEHILNTRYINYHYYDSGASYIFYDGSNIIRTKHVFSKLYIDDQHGGAFAPTNFIEFQEDIQIPKHEMYARGIEDIRLFYNNSSKVRFIGTTVEYYHTGGNRMVVGDYDIENGKLSNGVLIESPYNVGCEKNWIPIPNKESDKEWFIYRWSPLEIGYIENNNLKISMVYPTNELPFFDKIRGSSIFLERKCEAEAEADDDVELIGVVHYCEGESKRQYFHMLVSLDNKTYKPKRYSDPFVFRRLGIEFCIGFTIKDDKYWFWVSQMDREPILIGIEQTQIKMVNIIK